MLKHCIYTLLVLLYVVSFCTCQEVSSNARCTFGLHELPIPEDAVIVGDVRKNPECQATSFNEYKPKDYPDYSGLRMITREEAILAENKDGLFGSTFRDSLFENNFVYSEYNMLVPTKEKDIKDMRVVYRYIQTPKTGSTSMKQAISPIRSPPFETYPINTTFTTIRHPISHFVSSIGEMMKQFPWFCYKRKEYDANKKKIKGQICNDIAHIYFDDANRMRNVNLKTYRLREENMGKVFTFLEKWSMYTAFHFKFYSFTPHLASQMFFYNAEPTPKSLPTAFRNIVYPSDSSSSSSSRNLRTETRSSENRRLDYPPSHKYDGIQALFPINYATLTKEKAASFFHVDAALRMEYHDLSLKELRNNVLPELKEYIPASTGKSNPQRTNTKGITISCEMAWKIYEYYKQDFVCFKYELPAECLKDECRAHS